MSTASKTSWPPRRPGRVGEGRTQHTNNASTGKKPKAPSMAGRPSSSLLSSVGTHTTEPKYKPKQGEKYMSERQQEYFRNMLIDLHERLLQQVDDTVSHIRHDTANYPDEFDRATREESFSVELRARSREYQLIQKIRDTIVLINTGKYGYCSKCSQEIGIARLEARPTANLCITCKTLSEEREHSR